MDDLRWLEWLLTITQDEIAPGIAHAADPDRPDPARFASVLEWTRAHDAWTSPVRRWARALPEAQAERYRCELTECFKEVVPNTRGPRIPRPSTPFSDGETRTVLEGMWDILQWLRWPDEPRIAEGWPITSGRISYGTGFTRRNGEWVPEPFVRVDPGDRSVEVLTHFVQLAVRHGPRIRRCNNPACVRGGAGLLRGDEAGPDGTSMTARPRVFLAVRRQINCSTACKDLKGQRGRRERLRVDERKRRARRQSQKESAARRYGRPAQAVTGLGLEAGRAAAATGVKNGSTWARRSKRRTHDRSSASDNKLQPRRRVRRRGGA